MMNSYDRHVLSGQLCLLIFMTICIVIEPSFLLSNNQGGVSNYGTLSVTVIPYTLGLGLAGLLTLRASWLIDDSGIRYFRTVLRIIGLFYLLILLTTYGYTMNDTIKTLHLWVTAVFSILQSIIVLWLGKHTHCHTVDRLLLLTYVIGFSLIMLTLSGNINLLLFAEAITAIGFGGLLIRASATLKV